MTKRLKTTKTSFLSPYFEDQNELNEEILNASSPKNSTPSKDSSCNHSKSENTSTSTAVSSRRLNESFYNQSCQVLAKKLLGKTLVRKLDGNILSGMIVETECYLGGDDKASHSYNGKRTDRTEPMYMKPGTAYVYSIYGMYFCFNISSHEDGSCVLIRALEPRKGIENMKKNRMLKRKNPKKALKDHHTCNGPSKLCDSLIITKSTCNKEDLSKSEILWIEDGIDYTSEDLINCKRIGIDSYGEEWANKPLRFYVRSNTSVSIRNKEVESLNK